jgi:hypothetical protein
MSQERETLEQKRARIWDPGYDFHDDLINRVIRTWALGGGHCRCELTHIYGIPVRAYIAVGDDSIEAQEQVFAEWEARGEVRPQNTGSPWRKARCM